MKKYQKISFAVVVLMVISSCAFYGGNITGNAALSNANYRHVGTVKASNRCVYVFHFGGNARKSQIIDLKDDLQKRYPLRNGLAWANVSVEMKTAFYVLWDVRRATLSADIIDFWPDTNTAYLKHNGYYFNDTIFIRVPVSLVSNNYIMPDSVFKKLVYLNALKENLSISNLTPLKQSEVAIGTEVIFIKDKKLIRGIIRWLDANNNLHIYYIDDYGEYKFVINPWNRVFRESSQ